LKAMAGIVVVLVGLATVLAVIGLIGAPSFPIDPIALFGRTQVAAQHPLSEDLGAIVRHLPGDGRLRRDQAVVLVDLEARGPSGPGAQQAAPLAFSPEIRIGRAHMRNGSLPEWRLTPAFLTE
jgi:hypothetical protein